MKFAFQIKRRVKKRNTKSRNKGKDYKETQKAKKTETTKGKDYKETVGFLRSYTSRTLHSSSVRS